MLKNDAIHSSRTASFRPSIALLALALETSVAFGATAATTEDPLASAFGNLPALWQLHLSPSGSKISYLTSHSSGIPIAIVWDLKKGKQKMVLASEKGQFELSWCGWANEGRLLCSYRAVANDAGTRYWVTRLVAVDADGENMKVLMQQQLKGEISQFQDNIIDWLPDEPKVVLIAVPERKGTSIKKLNIYTGRLRIVPTTGDSVRDWMTDGHGEVRLAKSITKRIERWRYRVAGESKWRLLHESKIVDISDRYNPGGFGDDPNQLFVYKPFEGRIALWSEDLTNDRASRVVYSHPEVDIGGALHLGKYHRMVAASYSTNRSYLHYFDKEVEEIANAVAALFPEQEVQIVDESWDKRFYLVYIRSDRNPGSYYRFDNATNDLARISSGHPQLDGVDLAPMKSVRYTARDGEQIPGYLTMPSSSAKGSVPAVIFPHGGPHSRDYWGYDWLAQFFAARGYAVLQSNYRGSGGFGESWSGEGGFRNWRVAIDDITDGARYLIEEGIATADRICIVGWSYGGYAALLSAVEVPDLYQCVVSIAGVTDLQMLIDNARHFVGGQAVREFVGKEGDVLAKGSPSKRAAEFTAPVLLFHGVEDINVPIEHSKKMSKALKKKKKKVDFIQYKGVEHSILRSDLRIDMLTQIGAFLDKNTRPRSLAE